MAEISSTLAFGFMLSIVQVIADPGASQQVKIVAVRWLKR